MISDKIKASLMAQFLVCAQAFWCFGVSLERRAGCLLTMTELNVVMQVICAMVMYYRWNKSLDAGQSIPLAEMDKTICR